MTGWWNLWDDHKLFHCPEHLSANSSGDRFSLAPGSGSEGNCQSPFTAQQRPCDQVEPIIVLPTLVIMIGPGPDT